MDEKNIVSTMVAQHRTLQKEVGLVVEILENDPVDVQKIVEALKQFKKDLVEHLELENNTFYAELLKQMKAKDQNTDKTEQFIAEMDGIAEVVVTFLEKYKDAKNIQEKIKQFKKEFTEIGETLTLRIESEEAGVYAYWGLF
jgi:regulator of sigma D